MLTTKLAEDIAKAAHNKLTEKTAGIGGTTQKLLEKASPYLPAALGTLGAGGLLAALYSNKAPSSTEKMDGVLEGVANSASTDRFPSQINAATLATAGFMPGGSDVVSSALQAELPMPSYVYNRLYKNNLDMPVEVKRQQDDDFFNGYGIGSTLFSRNLFE